MHLRTVWVATVGFVGGIGVLGVLGRCGILLPHVSFFLVGPLLPYVLSAGLVCGGGTHGVRALSLWGTKNK